jgi:hypothetical protein
MVGGRCALQIQSQCPMRLRYEAQASLEHRSQRVKFEFKAETGTMYHSAWGTFDRDETKLTVLSTR